MCIRDRQPWDACGLGWYAPSEAGNAVRNPGSSTGSGNEPCRCAKPTAIDGMRGFFPTSAACVKCPPPQDRSPSLDLRFRVKRLAGQPAPRRRAQTLKSPPNRAFYRFSLRAGLLRLLLIPGSTASRPGETWVYTGQIGAQNGISAFNANHEASLVWPPHSVRGVRTTFSVHFVSHVCADTPSLAKPSSHPNGCCRTIGYSADSFDQVRCYCLA